MAGYHAHESADELTFDGRTMTTRPSTFRRISACEPAARQRAPPSFGNVSMQ